MRGGGTPWLPQSAGHINRWPPAPTPYKVSDVIVFA